jgi:transcriptional regulator with XRE-family HTH domain
MPARGKSAAAKPLAVEERVAATLRSLREQQGLTLAALAAAADLSPAYLSRVENNSASLTLQNLARVAAALQVPTAAFFEENDAPRPLVVSRRDAGRRRPMAGLPAGMSMELPAADKRGKLMEPLVVEIKPRASQPKLRAHPGEEFNLVLEGGCEFFYGQERLALAAGDTVYYDATVPHGIRATGSTPCRLLAVVASRDYLFHGDISKLLQVGGR